MDKDALCYQMILHRPYVLTGPC